MNYWEYFQTACPSFFRWWFFENHFELLENLAASQSHSQRRNAGIAISKLVDIQYALMINSSRLCCVVDVLKELDIYHKTLETKNWILNTEDFFSNFKKIFFCLRVKSAWYFATLIIWDAAIILPKFIPSFVKQNINKLVPRFPVKVPMDLADVC